MNTLSNTTDAVRVSAASMRMVPTSQLVPYANNAKIHSVAQIAKLRASLREFGFVSPVLIDADNNILAGHGRVAAAMAEGMKAVPCVLVTDLTETQRKAYILADNRLAEDAPWDDELLKIELESLAAADFDTRLAGFEISEEGSVYVNGHTRSAPGQPAHADSFDGPDSADDSEYQAFVDKFKPKKQRTTVTHRSLSTRLSAHGQCATTLLAMPRSSAHFFQAAIMRAPTTRTAVLSSTTRPSRFYHRFAALTKNVESASFFSPQRSPCSVRQPVRLIISRPAVRSPTKMVPASTRPLLPTWANSKLRWRLICLTLSPQLMPRFAPRGLQPSPSTVIRRTS